MDKSLGTLLHFWGVFQFKLVQTLPSPHKQCWTLVSRFFFPSFNFVLGEGGGGERTATKFRKGCTVLRGDQEMTENTKYYSTVPLGLLSRIVVSPLMESEAPCCGGGLSGICLV